MGLSLSPAPTERPGPGRSAWQRLLRVCALVRYRFFLYAGLLPYLLGAAWAYALADAFDGTIFLSGLAGVVLAVVGVEAFNEYFDSRMGTDRVFNPADLPPMTDAVLWLGIAAFAGALAVGIHLTILRGWPILAFALLGGAAAIFYVAPPIRWAYRGLGELVIALSYGPWMVLGSLYLHTQKLSWQALVVSLVPGCLIMGLAVVNAIPDFHQDRLVGKRNLVVRLGRRRAVFLYLALSAAGLFVVPIGVAAGIFPWTCLAALLALPLLVESGRDRAFDLRDAARLRPGGAQHRCLLPGRGAAAHRGHRRPGGWPLPPMNRIDLLGAPLLVSWQITRDCDLCCLHCCTESAPGKRLPDELDADEAMRVADEIIRVGVPYVMLCGGEPLVVPHFLALAEKLGRAGVRLKIETNGQRFDEAVAERLARLPIRSVQISLDGDTEATYARQRVGASLAAAHAACRAVRAAGMPLEITFAPTRINLHEAEQVIERAHSLGAFRFNTGRLMRIGTAARLWDRLEPSEAEYAEFRRLLDKRLAPVRGRDGALLRAVRDPRWPAREPREPAGDPARAAQRLGQGGGGAAADLCRSAPRSSRRRLERLSRRVAE